MGNPGSIIGTTLKELRDLVGNIVNLTATFSNAEVLGAVNYGYGKAVRAIRSVNPGHFLSYYDPFVMAANVAEFDIGGITPPIWRPIKVVSPSVPATTNGRVVHFTFQDFRSHDFESREASATGTFDRIAYHIVEGKIPDLISGSSARQTTVDATNSTQDVVATTGGWPTGAPPVAGRRIKVSGAGQQRVLDAENSETDFTVGSDYFGVIVSVVGNKITVTPQMGKVPDSGADVLWYRGRVMLIAPALSQGLTGRLWYQTQPEKLRKDTDALDPICSEHRDQVVAYAAGWLLRAVNDSQAERWLLEAQDMRSEMMQDIDPLADSNTEAFDSALFGIPDGF